jgi:hypothetical protein
MMFGVDALRQSNHNTTTPIVAGPAAANSVPIGGRLGGIASADTATGWYLLHEYNPPTLPSTTAPNREDVQVQRNGSAPTAGSQRIVGPGEGVNAVSDDSSASNSIPPIVDPAEGLNPKR